MELHVEENDFQNTKVKEFLYKEFEAFYKKNDIKGFEKIKNIYIET